MTQKISVKLSPHFWQTISVAISIAVFILILVNRSPNLIRPISMALRTGFGSTIPLVMVLMYAAFRIPGRIGELMSLTSTMALFSFALAGLWASGQTQPNIISGLLPVNDAANYYIDALRILSGMDISNFSAMRPFFPGFLSLLLYVTNHNLMVALGILTAITGISCYFASREIQRTHGTEPAIFFLIMMFLYFRFYSGATLSESLGLAFSLLGLAIIWQGTTLNKEWSTLFGLVMVTIALNIRPGAMFILPAILLWGSLSLRGTKKISIRFLLVGVMLILAVFYLHNLVIKIMAGPGGVAFSNFSWALYGLASGGNSWTYVFQAHPELISLDTSEQNRAIYNLVINLIIQNPSLLIKGAFFYWKMFFSSTWYNAYSFAAGDNFTVNEITRWGMYFLGSMGFIKWYADRKDAYASLAGFAALGVLASVPFVPPTDAFRVRLYAATIPFFGLLPAMGLAFLRDKINLRFFPRKNLDIQKTNLTVSFSILLITLISIAPIIVKTNGHPPATFKLFCPPEMDSITIRYDLGTFINVTREDIIFLDWMPNYHNGLFRRNSHSLADTNLIQVFGELTPPSTLFYALDYQSNREALVIIKTDKLPQPNQLLFLCGFWDNNPEVIGYKIFHADHIIDNK